MIVGNLKIKVKSEKKQYPINIGSDEVLKNWKALLKPYKSVLVVSDTYVSKLYRENFPELKKMLWLDIPEGEVNKNILNVQRIYDALFNMNADRNTVLIALGGGVIGDTAGFAAATYLRGIPFIQIPTTLLSQVDSSIGGKVGVNYGAKNLIGCFYHPERVEIDSMFWNTLDERQWINGLGEIIKYAFLIDREFLFSVFDNSISIKKRSSRVMLKLIRIGLMFKMRIVEIDEKESNVRRILNLGHTLGHAIESAGNYHKYLHGEAVYLGLKAMLFMSYQRKLLKDEDYDLGIRLINKFYPHTLPDSIEEKELLELLNKDKKRKDGENVWILLKDIGEPEIVNDVSSEEVVNAIKFIRG